MIFHRIFNGQQSIRILTYLFFIIIQTLNIIETINPQAFFGIHSNQSSNGNDINNLFLEPYLFPNEKSLLYKYMDQSHVFFEFGSGGCTHQAAKRRLKIYSAEIGPAWHDQLRKEFKEIVEKINNRSENDTYSNFSIDITYLMIDLQSQKSESYEDRRKYTQIYNHTKYQADLILIDGKFKFACVMNVYKEIDNKTFLFIHELNKNYDYSNVTKYFDIIEKVNRSIVVRKKYPPPFLSNETLKNFENFEILTKNKKMKRIAYLRKVFNDIIERYRYSNNSDMVKPKIDQIWFFWWTGLDNAPPIVKMCIESIQRNFKYGKVTVITSENYMKFTSIPSYVIEKFNAHKFKVVHFTDIYRTSLLASKGGMWIDATIFVNKEISMDWFNYPFYTIHFDDDFDLIFGKWCGFIQSSYINCIVPKFVSEMLFAYWEKFDRLVPYFLIDYMFIIGYDFIPAFNRLIQKVPLNNGGVHQLYNHINEQYSENLFNEIWSSSGFFKLTWKKEIKSSVNGKKTIFGHLEEKIK